MKKLTNLCIAIIALVGLSSSAFADGTTPLVGATHTYSVADNSAAGNTYVWSVTTDYQGTDVTGAASAVTVTGDDTFSASITWDAPTIGDTYFVHVVETNSEGCSNHKVMAVTPINGFALDLASVSEGDVNLDGTEGKELEACAPDVSVTNYDGTDFTYDYGENTFYYRITASGISTSTGWSPNFTIGVADASASYTATWGTDIAVATTTGLTTDGVANDINVTGSLNIWVKVVVDNAEGISANDIVVTLLDSPDTSEDINGNDVTSITGSAATQTVKARPNTTGIATN